MVPTNLHKRNLRTWILLAPSSTMELWYASYLLFNGAVLDILGATWALLVSLSYQV